MLILVRRIACVLLVASCGLTVLSGETGQQHLVDKYPDRARRLLAQLDLGTPGLEKARNAFEREEWDRAISAVIQFYREKPLPDDLQPDLPPARKDILELADDANRDIFTIQSRTYQQPRLPDGTLDWDDPGPNQDKEWAWMMNRHHHFNFLLTAYQYSGDSRYLETISQHLVDWIPSHPPPDYVTFSTSWRALEAARRIMDSWLAVFFYAKNDPAITDEALFLMLSSIPEHAESLRQHYSFWGGNHKVTEKTAIAICALAWPEFRESEIWLQQAYRVIREELFRQTYPDGSYKELANHYQKVVAENYLRLLRILRTNDVISADNEFRDRVEAMWDYFAYVARPSGFGPLNSDSSLEDNFTYLAEANRYFKRPDWSYILSYGTQGQTPTPPPSRYFPWAGHAVMRNSWKRDAHWAFLDIGPYGSAHQHDDSLHLSISLGEHDLLVDSGRYIYKPGPMRDYFRSGSGHNTMRVDGVVSTRPPNTVEVPIDNPHSIQPRYDYFQGRTSFDLAWMDATSVEQIRTVFYLRDQGWLVIDELIGFGDHRFETNWNFHPDCIVTKQGDHLKAILPEGQNVSLQRLCSPQGEWSLVRGQTDPEIRGWYSWAYNEKRAGTSARYTYHTSRPHLNVWWIVPERAHSPGSTSPRPTVEFENGHSLPATFSFTGGRESSLTFRYHVNGRIEGLR